MKTLSLPILVLASLAAVLIPAMTCASEMGDAIMDGRADAVRTIIANSPGKANETIEEGRLPIHLAANVGNDDIVNILLDAGADVNSTDSRGEAPVHEAVCCGQYSTLGLLIKRGANLNARGSNGRTPLHCVLNKPEQIAALLIQNGASVNNRDNNGRTPLYAACALGDPDCVRVMIEAGAAADDADFSVMTPMHCVDSPGYFYDSTSEVEKKAEEGRHAEEAMKNEKKICDMLVSAKAKFDARDRNGDTPVHAFAKKSKYWLVEFAASKGADMNVKNIAGEAPLHSALAERFTQFPDEDGGSAEKRRKIFEEGKLKTVTALVAAGADVNLADGAGNAPLDVTRRTGGGEITAFLESKGARAVRSVKRQDSKGSGPVVSYIIYKRKKKSTSPVELTSAPPAAPDMTTMPATRPSGIMSKLLPRDPEEEAQKRELFSALEMKDAAKAKTIVSARPGLVNARDRLRRTPLIMALDAGNNELARYFMDMGADVNPGDDFKQTALWYAVLRCDDATLKAILDRKPVVDTPNNFGNNALILAADMKKYEAVKMLAAAGAKIDFHGMEGATALMVAAEHGDLEMVRLLLGYGANIEARDNYNRSAVIFALVRAHYNVARLLIERGADLSFAENHMLGWTPLMYAMRPPRYDMRDVELIKLIMKKTKNLELESKYGTTALMECASGGMVDLMKLLIDCGADVNHKSAKGYTALICAAASHCLDAASLLIEKGARADETDPQGNSPLMHVASSFQGQQDQACKIIELLVSKGADINRKNAAGKTALSESAIKGIYVITDFLLSKGAKAELTDRACANALLLHYVAKGDPAGVDKCLDAGADPNTRAALTGSALMLAASRGNVDIMSSLLKKGADVALECGSQNALTNAAIAGNFNAVKFLVEKGADPKHILTRGQAANDGSAVREKRGSTALNWGAYRGNAEMIEYLLDRGAGIDVQDESGRTALITAADSGNTEAVRILIKRGADMHIADDNRLTALGRAKLSRKNEVVRILEEAGAK